MSPRNFHGKFPQFCNPNGDIVLLAFADYHTLRIIGLTFAAVLVFLSILLLTGKGTRITKDITNVKQNL